MVVKTNPRQEEFDCATVSASTETGHAILVDGVVTDDERAEMIGMLEDCLVIRRVR